MSGLLAICALVGAAIYGLVLLVTHWLFMAMDKRRAAYRSAQRARIRKHVRTGYLWS